MYVNDMRALGTMQKLLLYEAGTKKDGVHTCFELRRSEAQIFFCLLEARLHFSIIPVLLLVNEINMHVQEGCHCSSSPRQ